MTASKQIFVGDLAKGMRVKEVFLCKRRSVASDRNGRAFLSMVLGDRTGTIDALLWRDAEEQGARVSPGDVVEVAGSVSLFQGRLQLHLTEVAPVDPAWGGDLAPEIFLGEAEQDPAQMWAELLTLLRSVEDPRLGELVERLAEDGALVEAFKKAPAAKTIHHARLGGLLEHTLSVVRLTEAMVAHYRQAHPGLLNRDICLLGAFLHDLGKVHELSSEGGLHYTDEGRLLGHLILGLRILDRALEQVPEMPGELADALRHVLLSHHGRLEHGSPKRPKTAEAMLVSAADRLDSTLAQLAELRGNLGRARWSPYNTTFDRYLYFGWPSGDREPEHK